MIRRSICINLSKFLSAFFLLFANNSLAERLYHLDRGVGDVLEHHPNNLVTMRFDNGSVFKVSKSNTRRRVNVSHGIKQGSRAYHINFGTGNVLETFQGYLKMTFDSGRTRVVMSPNARRTVLSSHGIEAGTRAFHFDFKAGCVREVFDGYLSMEFDSGRKSVVSSSKARKTVTVSHGVRKNMRAYHVNFGAGIVLDVFDGHLKMLFDDGAIRSVYSTNTHPTVSSSNGVVANSRAYHIDFGAGQVLDVFNGYLKMRFDSGRVGSVNSSKTRRTIANSSGVIPASRIYHPNFGAGTVADVFAGYLKVQFDSGLIRSVIRSNVYTSAEESHGHRAGMRAYHVDYNRTGGVVEVFSGFVRMQFDDGRSMIVRSENAKPGRETSQGLRVGVHISHPNFGQGQVTEVFQSYVQVAFEGRQRVVLSSRCRQTRHQGHAQDGGLDRTLPSQSKQYTIDTIPLNLTAYTTLFGKASTPLLLASSKLQKLVEGHRNGLLLDNKVPVEACDDTDCPICLDGDFEEGAYTLPFGHRVHPDCLAHMIKSKLANEDLETLSICPNESCDQEIDYRDIGHFVSDPETLIRLQRLIIRHIPDVR